MPTKSEEGFALLDSLLGSRGENPATEDLARLKELAEQLVDNADHSGHCLLGCYYALTGERALSDRHHRLAIGMAPGNPLLHMKHAASLESFGDYEAAIAATLEAIAMEPENPDLVFGLVALAKMAGDADLFSHWLGVYESLAEEKEGDPGPSGEDCFLAHCRHGGLREWEDPEEDEAWHHLQ